MPLFQLVLGVISNPYVITLHRNELAVVFLRSLLVPFVSITNLYSIFFLSLSFVQNYLSTSMSLWSSWSRPEDLLALSRPSPSSSPSSARSDPSPPTSPRWCWLFCFSFRRSVFRHLARRFWNQTWNALDVQHYCNSNKTHEWKLALQSFDLFWLTLTRMV